MKVSWACGLSFALLLTSLPAKLQARPRLTTRIRRVAAALRYHLPSGLRGETNDVEKIFDHVLARDPSTRTGFGEYSRKQALTRRLRAQFSTNKALLDAVDAPDGRLPQNFIVRIPDNRVPDSIRPQLEHSYAQLALMVGELHARGETELARMLALDQSDALRRAIEPATYEDEHPEREGFREERLILMPPPPGSGRAVVLRSRQPARINMDEIVAAAAKHDIKPEEIAVVDLRFESKRDSDWVARAGGRALARVNVIRMPMLDHSVPTFEQLAELRRILHDPHYKLVHIHCAGGRGRTGVVVAAIRVEVDGWDAARALAEADGAAQNGRQIITPLRPLQEWFVRKLAERVEARRMASK
jgi:hypothetical protein